MKNNNQQPKSIAIHSIEDNAIEPIKRELDAQHMEFLKEVPFIASSFAHGNYPQKDNNSIEPYFKKVKGFYQRLKNDVPLKLQGALQLLYGTFDIGKLDESINKKAEERAKIEKEKHHLLDTQNKNGIPKNINSYKWAKYLLWFLGFVDVVSVVTAFLNVFSDNYFIAIVLGISIGVSMLLLIKSAVLDMRDNPETSTRKRVKWIIIILLAIVAIIIGGLRYAQTADSPEQTQTMFASPLVFIVINFLIMAATAYVVYMYYPSDTEVQCFEQYNQLQKEIALKENQIKELDIEIDELKNNKNAIGKYRLQLRHFQQVLYQRIQAMYEEAFGVYIEHNLKHRTDGVYPLCFNDPIPTLDNMENEDEKITNVLKYNNHED